MEFCGLANVREPVLRCIVNERRDAAYRVSQRNLATSTAYGSAEPPVRPPRETVAKLSFSDQHALKTLPGEIEAQNKQIAGLQAELSDPRLYASNAARFTMLSAELAELEAKRDANEELWLALEMKREALEG